MMAVLSLPPFFHARTVGGAVSAKGCDGASCPWRGFCLALQLLPTAVLFSDSPFMSLPVGCPVFGAWPLHTPCRAFAPLVRQPCAGRATAMHRAGNDLPISSCWLDASLMQGYGRSVYGDVPVRLSGIRLCGDAGFGCDGRVADAVVLQEYAVEGEGERGQCGFPLLRFQFTFPYDNHVPAHVG